MRTFIIYFSSLIWSLVIAALHNSSILRKINPITLCLCDHAHGSTAPLIRFDSKNWWGFTQESYKPKTQTQTTSVRMWLSRSNLQSPPNQRGLLPPWCWSASGPLNGRYRHWRYSQTSHRDTCGAQKRNCCAEQGSQQDGWFGEACLLRKTQDLGPRVKTLTVDSGNYFAD